MTKELTVEQKVSIVANCDEVMMAAKMLIGLMEDADLKNNVTIDYDLFGQNYKLEFTKLQKVEPKEVKIGYDNQHELCCCDNPNGFKEMEEGKEFCSQCKKPF